MIYIVMILSVGILLFDDLSGMYKQRTSIIRTLTSSKPTQTITENDLDGLPDIIRKYMKWTGVVGKNRIKRATVKQSGGFKMKPGMDFFKMKGFEVYTTEMPSFVWRGVISRNGLRIYVLDQYFAGEGHMFAKLLGFYRTLNVKSPEMDIASAIRFLNELLFVPTGFLEEYITWESVDDLSAKAIFREKGLEVSAVFHFDEEGRPVSMISEERYMIGKKESVIRPWVTHLTEYKNIQGYNIPASGSAFWVLDEGDFTYLEMHVDDICYEF